MSKAAVLLILLRFIIENQIIWNYDFGKKNLLKILNFTSYKIITPYCYFQSYFFFQSYYLYYFFLFIQKWQKPFYDFLISNVLFFQNYILLRKVKVSSLIPTITLQVFMMDKWYSKTLNFKFVGNELTPKTNM